MVLFVRSVDGYGGASSLLRKRPLKSISFILTDLAQLGNASAIRIKVALHLNCLLNYLVLHRAVGGWGLMCFEWEIKGGILRLYGL